MANFEITWTAPEFEFREKTVSWYWITIIIAACIIAFAVWERNFLFGVFIIIAEMLVIVWGNRRPPEVAFRLTHEALSIGSDKSYQLKEFENWSALDFEGGWHEMAFLFKKRLRVPVKILVPSETLPKIRENLNPLLPEVEHHITFSESIERLIKF